MKYSNNYERDYNFYLNNIPYFQFCGTLTPKHKAISDINGKTAKNVFYSIDTYGKNIPCCEPTLLNQLLLCKASVNFHIKQWAESRADGTLPYFEFAGEGTTLEWSKGIPIHCLTIKQTYQLPDWVIKAVEHQKLKYYND